MLTEELGNIPEWNKLTSALKEAFKHLDSEVMDDITVEQIKEILQDYDDEVYNLVARLVMKKVTEDWINAGNDEFDRLVKKLKGVA